MRRVAETAEQIAILFRIKTHGDSRNIVLDGDPDPPRRGGFNTAFARLLWPLVTFERGVQLVAQFAERIVARLVVGNNVDPVPRSTSVLEKILTRINGRVHRRQNTRSYTGTTCPY